MALQSGRLASEAARRTDARHPMQAVRRAFDEPVSRARARAVSGAGWQDQSCFPGGREELRVRRSRTDAPEPSRSDRATDGSDRRRTDTGDPAWFRLSVKPL